MSRRILAPLALAASLALSAGCDSWLTKPSLYNTVTVVVTQRNGAPVRDADLVLYTGQRPVGYAKSGADGRYTFARVPEGLYGIRLTPPRGFDFVERWIPSHSPTGFVDDLRISGDTLAPVRFTLLKEGPGTIVVRVVQPDGSPIPGAQVIAYDPQRQNATATTDAAGTATFPALPYGVHGVVVLRPFLYRDYAKQNDSLYVYRDDLLVDDGSRDTVVVRMQRCAGSVRALVVDQTGQPVPGTTAAFYSASQEFGVAVTGADGRVAFSPAPCATQLGIYITPAAGYSVPEGRGSRFIDGFTVTNGNTSELTFRVQRIF